MLSNAKALLIGRFLCSIITFEPRSSQCGGSCTFWLIWQTAEMSICDHDMSVHVIGVVVVCSAMSSHPMDVFLTQFMDLTEMNVILAITIALWFLSIKSVY